MQSLLLNRVLQSIGVGSSTTLAAAVTCPLQKCWASSSSNSTSSRTNASSSSTNDASSGPSLSPEQQQHLSALQYLISRPLEAAQDAALLTALTAGYRDLYVVMDLMHKKDILGIPRPLLDDPPAASSSSDPQQQQQQLEQQPVVNHTQMFYPVRDLTKLPDQLPPEGGWLRNHLQEKYMTRITAFAQLLPNHLEVSYQAGSFIYLWPAMEAYYPGFFDVENMLRHLKPHWKRTRTSRPQKNRKVRCSLGWRRKTPYHKQRVFGTPTVPAALQ